MPQFNFVARNMGGEKIAGTDSASDRDELVARLQARGLIVSSIDELSPGGVAKASAKARRLRGKRFTHYGININDSCLFCRQLATLLGAGVTILEALAIISRQLSSKRFYETVVQLRQNMESGLSLHEAMARSPKVFSGLWTNLVESGEASGNLAIVLSRLAGYLEREAKFRQQIVSALIYPVILLLVAIGALLFLTLKLIPTFADMFASFNIELPFLTRIMITISDFLRGNLIFIVLGMGGLAFLFHSYVKKPQGRKSFELFLFKLPVLGDLFRNLVVERFSSSMTTLTESGVPILYALEITERCVDNLVMAEIVRDIKEGVKQGKSLTIPMESSMFFEPMVVQMVNIGEEIGDLPGMFKRIQDFYEETVQRFLVRLTSMFEPLMIVFMGGVIGVMVVGMFLPMFQISKLGSSGGG